MSEHGHWEIENVPDDDHVFYRVPVGWLRKDKKPHPGVFKLNGESMSTDWDKYSTANATRGRNTVPERFAVLRLPVGCVRMIRGLSVSHDPINQPLSNPPNLNRAHCSVYGLDPTTPLNEIGYSERVRLSLLDCVGDTWAVAPGAPVQDV